MPSLSSVLTALSLAALSIASPLASNDGTTDIQNRDEWQPTAATLACLYMTNEANWEGEGINLCEVGSYCGSKLPDGLTANVSSAGPEAGVTCFLFSEEDCQGDRSAPLVNPGYGDLQAIQFDKKARSWKCWKWCGWMGPESSSSLSSMAAAAVSMSETVTRSVGRILAARAVSITTTIDEDDVQTSAPAASITTTIPFSATSATTAATSTAPASSQTQIFHTSFTTIIFTHTYANGDTTVVSSPLAIPIPVSSGGPEAAGGAVSVTATEAEETLEAPAPFSTLEPAGVRITTTLSADEPAAATTTSEAGVGITTTAEPQVTVRALTSEGITEPSSASVSSPAASSSALSSNAVEVEERSGWTTLVTLTGVDATLTVTATGDPAAGSMS